MNRLAFIRAASAAVGLMGAMRAAQAATLAYEWPLDGSLAASTGSNDLQAQTSTYTSYQSTFTPGTTGNDSYSSSSVPSVLAANQGYTNSVSLSGITNDAASGSPGYSYGQGSLVSASNVGFTNTQSYSISIWVNMASLSTASGYIVNLGEYDEGNSSGYGTVGIRDENSALQLDKQAGGSGETTFGANLSSTLNGTWVNIIAAVNASTDTASLYVNGQLFASSSSWTPNTIQSNPVFVGWRFAPDGNYPGSPPPDGTLVSDLQIYNGALAQSDAESIYETGSLVPEPASLGLFALGSLSLLRRRRPMAPVGPHCSVRPRV